MDALTQRITLVRTEAERLQDYLGTLSPTAWHHPSACAGWEVGDVVAHLTRGAGASIELFPPFQARTTQFTVFLESLTTQDWERPATTFAQ